MIETAGYAGRCPDGQEVQYAQELYEQVESENHLAILLISVGRALTIRGEFDVALLMYLRSLWHALATSDISLRRKASGNALRLAYYLQYGACTLHEMRQFELPAQSSSPLNRGDVQKILEASRDGMEAGLAMGERLLNTYANSMDQSMWREGYARLCGRWNPEQWCWFLCRPVTRSSLEDRRTADRTSATMQSCQPTLTRP